MSLSCNCDFEAEGGDICWWWPSDYSTLKTKRARKCCSCGDRIEVGDIVAFYDRYKVSDCEIEYSIYGEGLDEGPPRAAWYHCEKCADILFSLKALGFCMNINDDMRGVLRDYQETYKPQKMVHRNE